MEEIAARVKQIRKDFGGMTQIEFASRIGVTSAHISKIEKGKTIPSDSLIKLICKEFDINEKWFKNGEGEAYINDIQTTVDSKMLHSSEVINKILRSGDIEFRLQIAYLNSLFTDIVDISCVDDTKQMEYLKLCEHLFKNISRFTYALKTLSIEGLVVSDSLNTEMFFEIYGKPVFESLNSVQSQLSAKPIK